MLESCFDLNKKEYQYIEKATGIVNEQTIISAEHKPLLIKAIPDSAAYIHAYLNFCLAQKIYRDNFKKSGTKAGKPLSFQLLKEESIDVSRSVNFRYYI